MVSGLEPLTSNILTVAEAAAYLRIGRNHCYELIRQGTIPHLRLGRIIRVPAEALSEWTARSAIETDPVTEKW